MAHSRLEANTRHVDLWDLLGQVPGWFADLVQPANRHGGAGNTAVIGIDIAPT